jgi:hypothetical protein
MATFDETRKEIQTLTAQQREFYQLVGHCIKAWASIEDQLFAACDLILKTNPRLVAIIFYRTPTIDTRLQLTSELLQCVLPQREKAGSGRDHPIVAQWKQFEKEIRELLPIRNLLAHSPVWMVVNSPAVFDSVGNITSPVTMAIATSPKERLRGRDPRQISDHELLSHLETINTIRANLAQFISGLLKSALP